MLTKKSKEINNGVQIKIEGCCPYLCITVHCIVTNYLPTVYILPQKRGEVVSVDYESYSWSCRVLDVWEFFKINRVRVIYNMKMEEFKV
jgi:hypothetical protein